MLNLRRLNIKLNRRWLIIITRFNLRWLNLRRHNLSMNLRLNLRLNLKLLTSLNLSRNLRRFLRLDLSMNLSINIFFILDFVSHQNGIGLNVITIVNDPVVCLFWALSNSFWINSTFESVSNTFSLNI